MFLFTTGVDTTAPEEQSVAFECRADPPIMRIRVEPPYSAVEIEEELRRFVASPSFRPGLDTLVVVRGSQNTPAREIRRYATMLGQIGAAIGRRISICTDNDLAYGLSRMFAVFASPAGYEVAVFRDPAAAERWLLEGDEEASAPPAASSG